MSTRSTTSSQPPESDGSGFVCPSCGVATVGRFCRACGERRLGPGDRALRRYLEAIVDFFTKFDSKGYRSLWYLVARPGHLSVEQLRGSRVRYAKPFSLFLSLNVLCYFSISTFGTNAFTTPLALQLHKNDYYGSFARSTVEHRLAESGMPRAELEARYDERTSILSKTMIFVFIPIYALLFAMLFPGKRRHLIEHAVIATHLWCFILLLLAIVVPPIAMLLQWLDAAPSVAAAMAAHDVGISVTLQAIIAGYLLVMVRRVYGVGPWYALTVALTLAWGFFHIVWLYRFFLFVMTMRTL